MVGREGLQRLMQKLCTRPPPADYLALDDLSRLTRDVADFFTMMKQLNFHGVEVVSVADGLNTLQPGAKIGFGTKALMNEFFLSDLRQRTHRGLEGRL
jgi:DNA invertase Pin-like site-specific DNA recombinase